MYEPTPIKPVKLPAQARRLLVTLLLFGLLTAALAPAAAQDDETARITSPRPGETLVGVVTIQGTASNPNFQRYKLEFSPLDDGGELWFPITEITQQVTSGPLAQWNTANVPDGRYQIRLRVILRDGTVVQQVVDDLTVSNAQPTPLPTPLPPATPLPPTPLPTEGPSPTPLIQQPPTLTPRPTLAVIAQPAPPPDAGQTQFVLAVEALQNAFCNGVYLALGVFALLGLYRFVHLRLRPRLRRLLAELRGEQS